MWRAITIGLTIVALAALNKGTLHNMVDAAQAEYDSAFAQAAVKPPRVIDPMAPLPHYPQQRYVDKNLAPEQNLSYSDVGELASARKLAESTGVLSKELGAHMLPMAMVEGRSGNYGINDGNSFRASSASLARAKSMQLDVTDLTDPATAAKHQYDVAEDARDATGLPTGQRNYYRNITIQGPNGPMQAQVAADGPPLTPFTVDYATGQPRTPGNKMLQVNGSGGPGDMARMMAFILAEKSAVANGDVAGAVKRYNGAGPATDKYLAKVQAAKGLLLHPKNAQFMQYYSSQYLAR